MTKTADTNDGVCDDDCSLREAIDVAGTGDTIRIPSGFFTVDSQIGIDRGLILQGEGKDETIIQAAQEPGVAGHRIFNVTIDDGDLILRDLTIRHGAIIESFADGGAILWAVGFGNLRIERSAVVLNEVNADGPTNGGSASGGAIFGKSGVHLAIIDSIIADNRASANGTTKGGAVSGGAIFGSVVDIERTAIVRNRASALGASGGATGGGLFATVLDVANSTVSNNGATGGDAASGGAASAQVAEFSSSTIVENFARGPATRGGGVLGLTRARNSIFARNEPENCFGTLTSDGFNFLDIECGGVAPQPGDQIGTQSSPLDPLIGPLADNGGMTLTHNLLFGSPAIDGGNPAGCTDENATLLLVDQRNFDRTVDGDGDGSQICDIGALEVAPAINAAPLLGNLALLFLCATLTALGMRRRSRRG